MKITTSFCAEECLIKKIQEQAERENRSFSNLLETILIKYLNQEQTNKNTEHITDD
jgi:hypothetical protein